jgi:predicted kinase
MKQLIFLRGASGSGKTTFANFLAENLKGKAISADDYFTNKKGEYKFDERLLGKAHKWCLSETERVFDFVDTVVIHNTSVDGVAIREYQNLAEKLDAKFISLIVENRHGNMNTHEVSDEKVEAQAMRLLNNIQLTPNYIPYSAIKSKPKDPSKLEVVEYLRRFSSLTDGLKSLESEHLINSTRLKGKVLLKYSLFASKNSNIVRECRGIILDEKTLEVVSLPLEKFGNYGENYAANDIDILKSKVVEKLDGSCFILYYDQVNKKWCVQTLGQIEAEETMAGWGKAEMGMTWSELFSETFNLYIPDANKRNELFKSLNKDLCYVFELCTPWNRVVVKHTESKLYFLAIRNKKTFNEEWPSSCPQLYDVFDKPKKYPYSDIKEILRICKENLTTEDEGFIIIDDQFRRVKLKSHQYVEEHYKSTVVTVNSVTHVIFLGEEEEYLTIFPEYKGVVDIINSELNRLGKSIDSLYISVFDSMNDKTDKKEFAMLLEKLPNSYEKSFLFEIFYGRIKNGKEGIMWYNTTEWRKHKVDLFLKHSNVANLVNANKNNGSLK